ncbi:hypothetical protein [Dyella sp. GSA-30]|uniref:hypothetical protein n=1 Tax=Dyella sp. GSA-30 TaxID=2994496 RepID=UPI002490DE9A|nr:hypothetical protein [Dyella sp. GSA-30]
MKHLCVQFMLAASLFVGALMPHAVHAQTSEGPSSTPVYACVDNVAGIQSVRWVTSLPCIPPLLGTTKVGQPSQTVFTALYNEEGSLVGNSSLSGDAIIDPVDDVYTITFSSAFASTPVCVAAVVGASSTDFQIEVSNISTTGVTVATQSTAPPFGAAPAPFVLSCTLPR